MTHTRLLTFRIGAQHFGADVREVREVISAPEVTVLPDARPPVVGVFNLRGNIVTAVDGAQALGVEETRGELARAVVVEIGGQLVAILVDAATEVLTIEDSDVRATPRTGEASPGASGTRGIILVGERPIVLLDVPNLLKGQEEQAAAKAPRAEATP